jgi:broad specificity phosphatase PhoE
MRIITTSIVIIALGIAVLPSAPAQEVVYLIRHAEQALEGYDPPLTEAGHQRAKALAAILRDAEIDVIYTSQYRRTNQTGEAIARALDIPLETMSRCDVEGLVTRLRTRHADDSVLIVSHSGIIPLILREFGYLQYVSISKADYDNLLIVLPRGDTPRLYCVCATIECSTEQHSEQS